MTASLDREDEFEFEFVRYRGNLCVVVGDTIYEITEYLRAGASALLAGVPYPCNPHREGSRRYEEWNYGHELAQDDVLGMKLGGCAIDQLASLITEER